LKRTVLYSNYIEGMRKGVFIFRRDLRTNDNLALNKLCAACDKVVCVFVFSKEQIERSRNPFFGEPSFRFMLESLEDLRDQLSGKLVLLKGDTVEVLRQIRASWKFDSVAFNKDYTPYARDRDRKIKDWCEKEGIGCHSDGDYTLHSPEEVRTKTGEVYRMFTPFYRTASALRVSEPAKAVPDNTVSMSSKSLPTVSLKALFEEYPSNEEIVVKGGRTPGLKRLRNSAEGYTTARNTLHEFTTLMGAYIKFGCVSVREVYAAFKKVELLKRQLYWREFYAYVVYHTPEVLSESRNYDTDVKVKWVVSEDSFRKWCEGRTGFPLVDAGMRQMNRTGWMHNRARMVTASFLVKHLGIDWRKGERYFATKLVDYDPCNNNGGWQWSASTGTDAQPYFRIFNPWTQNKSHDPQCEYVRRWIPELRDVPVKHILRWYEHHRDHSETKYPVPMVVHEEARKASLARFKKN
jgi:deoxyribodipyrimidine photo-lyase